MERISELDFEGFEIYLTSRPLLVRVDKLTNQIEIMQHVQEELLCDILQDQED